MIVRPGQREWNDTLIDVAPGGESGLHFGSDADLGDGWWRRFSADDLETATGVSPGNVVPRAMYPAIMGLRAETPEAFGAFLSACAPGMAGTLSWASEAAPEGLVFTADAIVRRCDPREQRSKPYRLIDVVWLITGTIGVVP